MGFTEDEVKKFIQSNYRLFQDVRLDQLLIDLPCLTSADRQEIRCHMDRQGNILSVSEFFDHLWGRTGWVPQLISALENNRCERLAEIIRGVYQEALLPSQRNSAARSPPPVAQCYRSPLSVPEGASAPSFDGPPLSPPRNQPGSTNPLPTCVNALAPAPSESLQDVVDYRSPVQETKSPSLSSETASEAKAGRNDVKQKGATPGQRNRNAAESDANVAAQHENPTSVQAASPRSPGQHQTPPREVSEKEVRSSTPVPSSSDAGDSVRNWDSVQPRPVCVKNGYFGNVSRSVDSGLSPAPESSAPTAPGNQPEEDSYVSYDSSPLTRRGQDGAQAEEQKIPPLWGYQQDLFDNPTNQPFPPGQVDEEQKGAQGQQDSAGNVNAARLLREKGDRHGPFVPEPSRTASSLGQSPSKSRQLPQRSSSQEHFGQIPSPAVQFRPPPSGFSGFSSTDVIPPNSPAAVSVALSDAYPEDLKPPVQERNLRGTALRTTSKEMMGAVPPRANVARPSYAADIPANARENTNSASGPSRGALVFNSNPEEDDISLVKPGVLLSGELTGGALDQHPSHPSAAYSGTSARLRFSGGPSDGSDPLMLSDSTQGSCSEDSKRNTPMGTDRASLRRRNDNLPEEGSVRTHTVHVAEPPSVELTGAPEISRPALGNASQPPGDFSDSAAGDQPAGKGSSGSVRSYGRRDSCQNEKVADAASWHMSDSRLLAVGFALTSLAAVAFVLYKRLKK